jgi:excisionase family DNA binding protein
MEESFMEEWLTTYEAARLADYDPDYIRKLIRAKKIKARKWGWSWQVDRESLLEYVKTSEAKGSKRGPKKIDNE